MIPRHSLHFFSIALYTLPIVAQLPASSPTVPVTSADVAFAKSASQMTDIVLMQYAIDPTAKVGVTDKPLSSNGKWSVGRTPPEACPQTAGACNRVFYTVPGVPACEWIIKLTEDGGTGVVLTENKKAINYLLRRLGPADAAEVVIEKKLPIYSPIARAAHVQGDVAVGVVVFGAERTALLSIISGPEMLRGERSTRPGTGSGNLYS